MAKTEFRKEGWLDHFIQYDQSELATMIMIVQNLLETNCWEPMEFVGYSSGGSILFTGTTNFPLQAGNIQSESAYISPGTTRAFSADVESTSYNNVCTSIASATLKVVSTILRPSA